MNIVKPSYEILDDVDGAAILRKLELCGRTAYKSESRISSASAARFIRTLVDRGHESAIEHVSITIRFICDRGVTHEIVRHRLVSYTQESTRYCNYSKLGVTFVKPPFWEEGSEDYLIWWGAMANAAAAYNQLIKAGASPQEARSVLPNSLKTEIVTTANLREWRHILRLRTHKTAHPQMRELMIPLLRKLKERIPVVFDDIKEDV